MKKLVFYFDIDGTLATHTGITASNKQVLQQLKALHHHVIISSGRPAWYIKDKFGSLIDGFISSNGRHIEYHDEVLLDDFISYELLQKIVDTCNTVKCGYLFVGKDTMYLGNKQYITTDLGYVKDVIEDFSLSDINIYMFDIYYQNENHYHQINEAFKDFIILNDHGIGSADASTLDINKGSAVKQLTKHLNLTKEDSFAFGDGNNDLEMFKSVGAAIAMGNGSSLAKEHATYITDTVENDGIKKALEKYKIL